jgi:Type VI secretion system VasI, EvfG, VC_A0118
MKIISLSVLGLGVMMVHAVAQSVEPSLPPPNLSQDSTSTSIPIPSYGNSPLAEPIRKCYAIKDDGDRLHCYDAISATLPMVTTGQNSNQMGAWAIKNSPDGSVMGVPSTILDSDDPTMNDARASLFIRCSKDIHGNTGSTDVYINFGKSLFGKDIEHVPVAIKFDDGSLENHIWIPSTSGVSVGLWGGESARNIATRLVRSSRISVRVPNGHTSSILAVFALDGLTIASSSLNGRCGW